MNRFPVLLAAASLLTAPLALTAQEGEESFVRESAAFVVVPTYAANPNGIEIDNTAGAENGLSYEDFLARLATAYAEGRGGVIDFENPLYGDFLRLPDRRLVRGFINDYLDANPEGDERSLIAEARELAETATFQGQAVAKETIIITENRPDPVSLLNQDLDPNTGLPIFGDEPFAEEIRFDDILALYGPDNREELRIDRLKETSFQEIILATREQPGFESRATINDNYFLSVGPLGSSWQPVSGIAALGGLPTVFDFALDPRDNVKVLAFTLLSFANFQFWQGQNAFDNPDNADNILVTARFSDGTEQLFTATSQQLAGGWDNFFAIEAPEGTAMAGVYVRMVGRNFRTFPRFDDMAFIVAPAPPYIASATTIAGTAGNPLYYRLQTRKNPTGVSISGLPDGLTFDEASGLIRGTPTTAGDYTANVVLTSPVANVETTLTFNIGPTAPADSVPQITNAGSLIAILGRELPPFDVATTLDGTALEDSANYFLIAYKETADGEVLTTLANTGLSLSSGIISGTPRLASQVGSYRLEVFATNANGGDTATLQLNIFPPVPLPNFDGDTTTDLAIRRGGRIEILLTPEGAPETAASDLPTAATVLLGDYNGDNRTDFFAHDPASGQVDLYLMDGTAATKEPLFTMAAGSPWQALESRDVDGDGLFDIIWQNSATGAYVIWRLVGTDIRWAGFLRQDGVSRDLLATGDFDGSGTTDFLWQRADGTYEFFALESLRTDGAIDGTTETFTRPDSATVVDAADFNGDGITDLIWRTASGALYAWYLEDAAVPPTLRPEEAEAPIPADAGELLSGADTPQYLLGSADLDNNQRSDLLFAHRNNAALAARLLGVDFAPIPAFMADGATRRPAILRDEETGQLVTAESEALIADAYPQPGDALPLADDEALADYTVYQQARDADGNLQWTYQDFFALPVADTDNPVMVGDRAKNAFFDGYPLAGEALSAYTLLERRGDNDDGTPAPRRHPIFGVTFPIERERPVADPDNPDFVWTPDPSGVPYDARGARGFLAERDLFGNPLVDANGDPVLVRWPGNPDIPAEGDNLPWAFDREVAIADAFATVVPGSSPYRLAATGDINADNNLDLLMAHSATGALRFVAMDGLAIVETIDRPDVTIGDGLLTPRTVDATPASAATAWQQSPWFGAYQDATYPWLRHEQLGWIFATQHLDQPQWFYSTRLGWFFTGAAHFPALYSQEHDWLWFAREAAPGRYDALLFYAFAEAAWKTL